jgi:DNA replication initiation complex subunit (GINS family)
VAELTYDELRRLQRKEMASASLVPLPGEFYSEAEMMLKRHEDRLRQDFSLQLAREYENTLKIIRDIYSRREGKILLRAMRSARTGEEVDGLASEEKTLLSSVVTLLEKNRERFERRLSAKNEGKAAADADEGKGLRLKLLMDLPEFVGLDGNTYGPFKPGTEAVFPEDEAQRLLRRGAASEV